jgi:hypothetical protein
VSPLKIKIPSIYICVCIYIYTCYICIYCPVLKCLTRLSDFHTPLPSIVPFVHSETSFTHGCIYPNFPGSSGTTSIFGNRIGSTLIFEGECNLYMFMYVYYITLLSYISDLKSVIENVNIFLYVFYIFSLKMATYVAEPSSCFQF